MTLGDVLSSSRNNNAHPGRGLMVGEEEEVVVLVDWWCLAVVDGIDY